MDDEIARLMTRIPASGDVVIQSITAVYVASIRAGNSAFYAKQAAEDFIRFMSVKQPPAPGGPWE